MTFISRILGYVRDAVIAAIFGAGLSADAFFVAFRISNLFRRLLGEGALTSSFIPVYTDVLHERTPKEARRFVSTVFTIALIVLILITIPCIIFSGEIVAFMAPGFVGSSDAVTDKFALTVRLTQLMFPFMVFVGLMAVAMGVLHSFRHFTMPAIAPVLLNIILIGSMWIAYETGGDIGWALIWGIPVAGVGQMMLLWWAASKAGFRLRLRIPRMTPELKRLAIIALPAALAGGVVQVNLLVGRQVASYFDGAIAWLNYADRLYQLPLGVVGIAIGVVLLPDLSRRLRAGDEAGSQNSINRAAEFTLLLSLPAAVALVVIPFPIVSVLFQRGAFSVVDAQATALAVAIYGVGLPSFVLHKVLSPIYFAREDTRTPFRFALVSMVVNVVLAVGLAGWFGYLAAAIGTSVAGWAMLVLLWRGTRKMGTAGQMDDRLRRVLPKIIIASLVMGAVVWGLAYFMDDWLQTPTIRYGALLLLVSIAMVVYGALIVGLGAITPSEIKRLMKR